jgi:hypothetical protein
VAGDTIRLVVAVVSRPPPLVYRAGPRALAVLRDGGFGLDAVATWVGSASGPRWLALHGLDRALLDAGLAAPGRGARRWLVGASAGAWRALALASPDPRAALDRLLAAYVDQAFRRDAQPAEVSASYRQMLAAVFPAAEHQHLLAHPAVDLALLVARTRGLAASDGRWRQGLGLAAIAGWRLVAGAVTAALGREPGARAPGGLERGIVATAPERLTVPPGAAVARLSGDNLVAAALASGSVPLYMRAVRELAGLPRGAWRDGGLTDYHLAARWHQGDGITLLPHFAPQVLASWFDQLRRRPPSLPAAVVADLLVVSPTAEWIASLPGGRLPHRDDFLIDAERPRERQQRWLTVAARARELGERLAEDLASGALARLVTPLGVGAAERGESSPAREGT